MINTVAMRATVSKRCGVANCVVRVCVCACVRVGGWDICECVSVCVFPQEYRLHRNMDYDRESETWPLAVRVSHMASGRESETWPLAVRVKHGLRPSMKHIASGSASETRPSYDCERSTASGGETETET